MSETIDQTVSGPQATPINGDILVLNAGSSSIKYSLFTDSKGELELRASGQVEGIGAGGRSHHQAMEELVGHLHHDRPAWKPAAVGHRVVHGGPDYRQPVVVDDTVLANLRKLIPLAPLHSPGNLDGIGAASQVFPEAMQIACFDTAFHQGHPWVADAFALPRRFYDEGIRRYGFHGLSYAFIARAMRRLDPGAAKGRLIVAHLGNGASMCAIHDGRSIDSTMSFTALDGLAMGTRCGQIDPGVLLYLAGERRMTQEQISHLLWNESGLLGLSGINSDMRELLASKEPAAQEAVDYFVERIVFSTGALAAVLGGLDGFVFTAGIGEHAPEIRARVCRRLAWLGIELDEAANQAGGPRISTATSRVSAWVVPTDEAKMIAISVRELLAGS